MAWQTYGLDQEAQKLVLNAKRRSPESLNQSYKMRMTVAYGLERFWGEHLRLQGREQPKAEYWKEVWDTLARILAQAHITLPNDPVQNGNVQQIRAMAEKLWSMPREDQRVALAILTQLCDCLVWWTQRYK